MKLVPRAVLALALGIGCVALRSDSIAVAGTNPIASLRREKSDLRAFRARVEERIAAGSYTYLRVRTDGEPASWTVTLGRGQPAGTEVRVRSLGRAENFYSRRLQRTFPELTFGMVSRAD